MIELLFLLLPVAAASGWWLARREPATRRCDGSGATPAFFRGLNYLLDEQPDKAIDVFLHLAEVDEDTVETHLALGSLFRRRGEVDRAIRIHQNLIVRDNLSRDQRGFALFELAQDYMRAGLLDRAELLFLEVVELGLHQERSLRGLIDIFQQERDWKKCLEFAERIKPFTERAANSEIAQYHCELAEEARAAGDIERAREHLVRAQSSDPGCIRALILEGRIAMAAGEHQRAADLFLQVAHQGAPFVPEILDELQQTLDILGRDRVEVLRSLVDGHSSPPLILALAEAVLSDQGAGAAADLLTSYLSGHADLAALERLLSLRIRDGDDNERERVVCEVVRHLLARQSVYQCEHCGFSARSLHWQCPSCKRWASVKPVQPDPIPGSEVLRQPRIT